MDTDCENCWYNNYDEQEEAWYCEKDIDEDDWARFMTGKKRRCPFFITADDYYTAHRQ